MTLQSPFTWLSLLMFSGLVALMLRRSMAEKPVDALWLYAPPAFGCALVDYLGSRGFVAMPIIGLLLIVAYVLVVLRPTMH